MPDVLMINCHWVNVIITESNMVLNRLDTWRIFMDIDRMKKLSGIISEGYNDQDIENYDSSNAVYELAELAKLLISSLEISDYSDYNSYQLHLYREKYKDIIVKYGLGE